MKNAVTNFPLETFSELVGAIYDGLLETIPWQKILGRMRSELGANYVTLILRSPRPGDQTADRQRYLVAVMNPAVIAPRPTSRVASTGSWSGITRTPRTVSWSPPTPLQTASQNPEFLRLSSIVSMKCGGDG